MTVHRLWHLNEHVPLLDDAYLVPLESVGHWHHSDEGVQQFGGLDVFQVGGWTWVGVAGPGHDGLALTRQSSVFGGDTHAVQIGGSPSTGQGAFRPVLEDDPLAVLGESLLFVSQLAHGESGGQVERTVGLVA